jgi:hypothetical protein
MTAPLTRRSFLAAPRVLLNRGRYGNATVWRVTGDDGGEWVVKDFSGCPWPLRWTLGRWLAGHECRVLQHLQGIAGVPAAPFRLDALALGYRYIPGQPLRLCPRGSCGRDFFERLEALVGAIHARGIVHLDLRNGRNHLVGEDGRPALIDFQSAVATRRLPRRWRRILERVDFSGVYKHWLLHDPEGLGPEREATLLWQIRNRGWWRLRGYSLPGARRPLKSFERQFLARKSVAASSPPGREDG